MLHNNQCGWPWHLLSPAGDIAVCVLITEMSGAFSAHGGEQRHIQGFGGET